jgi:4-amino-4-deoxy-L-arabinose transferase-like glycosyltransferase
MFGGWMLVEMAVFSQAKGIFHPYYTVALAPPVAAVAGAGALAMWRAGRQTRWLAWVLPVAIIATAAWAVVLLGRTAGYDTWLRPLLLVGGIGSAVALGLLALGRDRRRLLVAGAGAVAAASLLAARRPTRSPRSAARARERWPRPAPPPRAAASAAPAVSPGVQAAARVVRPVPSLGRPVQAASPAVLRRSYRRGRPARPLGSGRPARQRDGRPPAPS